MGEARGRRSVIFVDGSMPRSVADELKAIGKDAIAKMSYSRMARKIPCGCGKWARMVGLPSLVT
jgi:hypothetical protein